MILLNCYPFLIRNESPWTFYFVLTDVTEWTHVFFSAIIAHNNVKFNQKLIRYLKLFKKMATTTLFLPLLQILVPSS